MAPHRPALCDLHHDAKRLAMERRANISGREHFEALRDGLIRRLQGVCAHFDPADLEDLVLHMARVQLRYERDTAVPAAS